MFPDQVWNDYLSPPQIFYKAAFQIQCVRRVDPEEDLFGDLSNNLHLA